MSTTDQRRARDTPSQAHPVRDLRGFWRRLLAVIAPLPMVAMGIHYLLTPVDGGVPFAETVAAYAGNVSLARTLLWFQIPFLVGLIPATVAVAWVSRRGAPRLATAGALIALLGFLTGFPMLGAVDLPYLTVTQGWDPVRMAAVATAIEAEPIQQVASLLFIVGIVIGLLLLGLALWRSRVAPAWTGILLAAGGLTHPFMPGHMAAGVGLLVTAVGFTGASWALLQMSNNEFDLPPRQG